MRPLLLRHSVVRRPTSALPFVLLAGVFGTLLLSGCGSTTRVGASRTFQVSLTEYHVAPQKVSVPTGTISIYVHNYGRLSHDLVISTGGRPLASSQPIPPGQTTELITPLLPGKYLMSSTILSDQALGAYGTLIVTR